MSEAIDDVLNYWFAEPSDGEEGDAPTGKELWFEGGISVDRAITKRFSALVSKANAGELDAWAQSARGRLALILVLDQFNRHIHRGTQEAYQGDERALALCFDGLDDGQDVRLSAVERCFFYMPCINTEDVDGQLAGVEVYSELCDSAPPADQALCRRFLEHSEKSRDVVERFDRLPGRNNVLDRDSSPDESVYLQLSGALS